MVGGRNVAEVRVGEARLVLASVAQLEQHREHHDARDGAYAKHRADGDRATRLLAAGVRLI